MPTSSAQSPSSDPDVAPGALGGPSRGEGRPEDAGDAALLADQQGPDTERPGPDATDDALVDDPDLARTDVMTAAQFEADLAAVAALNGDTTPPPPGETVDANGDEAVPATERPPAPAS